jgi:hypothetical protein
MKFPEYTGLLFITCCGFSDIIVHMVVCLVCFCLILLVTYSDYVNVLLCTVYSVFIVFYLSACKCGYFGLNYVGLFCVGLGCVRLVEVCMG